MPRSTASQALFPFTVRHKLSRLIPIVLATCCLATTLAVANDHGAEGDSNSLVNSIELIGVAEISGTAADKSGLVESLGDNTPHNQLGGFSAMDYSGADDVYYVVSDRGPKDGAVDYHCRFHRYRIKFGANQKLEAQLLSTHLFKAANGRHFTGLATAYTASFDSLNAGRFDPEGIRTKRNGNLLVSDEYGPHVIEFTPEGIEVCRYPVGARYLIANPGIDKKDENGKNDWGRQCNRGMEGLALVGADEVFGLMQSPLLQDSEKNEVGKPLGLNCRMVRLAQQPLEFLYHLDSEANKLNEVLSVGSNRFLTIERDGEIGSLAAYKKIMLIDTQNASNIANIDRLPRASIPQGIRAVSKRAFIDLLDPKWKLAGEKFPEKIESLTFGPDLPDGRKSLLVMSDNDFEPTATQLYVFAFPQEALQVSMLEQSLTKGK